MSIPKARKAYLFRTDGPGGAEFLDYGKPDSKIAGRPICGCCGNRTARWLRKLRQPDIIGQEDWECSGCLGYVWK